MDLTRNEFSYLSPCDEVTRVTFLELGVFMIAGDVRTQWTQFVGCVKKSRRTSRIS